MSTRKKCKLVHSESLTSLASSAADKPINWSLCALCQEPSNKPLNCPAKSKRTDNGDGYVSLGDNLESFLRLGKRPLPTDIARLEEGDGIGSTLAQWHTCRLQCSTSRLARAEATALPPSASSDASEGLPYMLRQAECTNPPKENDCFFCGEVGTEATPLHEAMTPRITQRVRQCALKLQDRNLIAQLSYCDLVAQEAKYHAGQLPGQIVQQENRGG